MANRLDGKKIALFVEEGFEDSELTEPLASLREEGAQVVLVGSGRFPVFTGKKGTQITPDVEASKVSVKDFDAFVVPGGHAPEKMRLAPAMVRLIEQADDQGRIIAAICHGPAASHFRRGFARPDGDELHQHCDRFEKCRRQLCR